MKTGRFLSGAWYLLLILIVLEGGCWGRKFFSMPRETISTSSRVDSLLKENAKLQRRVGEIENALENQQDYNRQANAQFKIDLEELKDQLNILQQMLRDVEQPTTYIPRERRLQRPDTLVERYPAGERATGPGREQAKEQETPAEELPETHPSEMESSADDTSGGRVGEPAGEADTTRAVGIEVIPSPEEIHRQAYLDYSRSEYQLALEESELFLTEYPDHPLGEEVRFVRGECFMGQEKYFDALKEFSIILQKYPRGRRVPAVLFRMAVSYESIDEGELAAGVVRRLMREYPYSEEAAAAEDRFEKLLQD